MGVCAHDFRCQWRPEEKVGSPGDGVTGGCEPHSVSAGN